MIEKSFLVEIGTEELPPRLLRELAESFVNHFSIELKNSALMYKKIQWYATPRRLAIKVEQLVDVEVNEEIIKRGPSLSIAFDAKGNATKAATSWAHNNGIRIDQTEHLITKRGSWLIYRTLIKKENLKIMLPSMVNNALKKLSIKQTMRWGDSNVQFVRPVHTITLLLANELITANILGIQSNRLIRGHRFMGQQELILNNADQYSQLLRDTGKVIAHYELRKNKIKFEIERAAHQLGGNVNFNNYLLEEVTSLVEWPVILTGKFEKKFLCIPKEVLIHVMTISQKYFPVYDSNGELLPNFIFVSNIEVDNPQQIIIGNETVLHARLSDADFFFKIDCKHPLEDNLSRLKFILFHKQLGTLHDRINRIQLLVAWIAEKIGADINNAIRVAMLSKCDLVSKMVYEFPETQGIMGMHYARYDGEHDDVAIAIYEQYLPRFSGDILPSNSLSCTIAIADKIDTIVGILGVNEHPKGDKDPFALRRAALGILRIIIEKKLPLDLQSLAKKTICLYKDKLTNHKTIDDVINFIFNRYYSWYELKGYSIDIIKAVISCRFMHPLHVDARIKAITHLRIFKVERLKGLIIVSKRISNILLKSTEELNKNVQISLLKENTEILLIDLITKINTRLELYFLNHRYQDALIELTHLNEPINNFFDKVIINTNDSKLRINRLNLLKKIQALFLQIADFSCLLF
ncbi:glycine--tRNA ligase subunit beta [Pantoea sp. Mhis]|uniref:glycine--tRNA ligase subunit beta n=1 Tax=Pantoea sp. Mhis TaxID=2576759 RepID=UPI001356F195|nr:glycine--tRNA ligase subunit beta [Pantoea sp. Mhis]MXP56701.1 glycine--tRNA ligase subunit beta [Pantoea sp. Mhis]